MWQALHDVHAFIASVRLADRDVDDSLQAGGGNARAAYLQALLVAPYDVPRTAAGVFTIGYGIAMLI